MFLGQTEDLKKDATMNQFSDRVEIKEGINKHRVLRGPFLVRTVYWPTLITEEGEVKQKTKSIVVPKTGSPLLKSLADAEKEFRRTMGESEPRSTFSPSSAYLYLIFNKDDPEHHEKPEVKLASYKNTIYTRLEEIQTEKSTKNPAMLKNGLIFMYDVLIKKTVGNPAQPIFTTRYTVDVDTENNVAQGQIPVEILKLSSEELLKTLEENGIFTDIFTPDELKAIEDCKIDIGSMYTPSSDEEVVMKLKEFPIFAQAKDFSKGTFLFPQMDQFMKFIEKKGLALITGEPKAKIEAPEDTPDEAQEDTQEAPVVKEAEVVKSQEEITEIKTEQGNVIKKWNIQK